MRRSVWVVLALLSVLLLPSSAYASDVDYLGSFSSGFQALTGNGSNAEVTPERDFMESYEPQEVVLSAPATREYDEDSTTVDYINGTLDSFNSVPVDNANRSLLDVARWTLYFVGGVRGNLVLTAAGIVFMWWGVRKCKNIIMTAFRTGRLSFGNRKVRDKSSYYYGTRPSDWR